MYSPKEYVEQFHLLFLDQLGRKVDKKCYALKGGCNLRFFFASLRYSEDMDLDVGGSLGRDVLQDKVNGILGSKPFAEILRARGMAIARSSAPKQTDTVQRWKMTLTAADCDAPMPTKVGFSSFSRGMGEDVRFEAVAPGITAAYRLGPIMANHYSAEAAFRQKIEALLSRRETQARDIFDLSLLAKSGVDGGRLREELAGRIEEIQDRAMSMGFEVFRSQVLAFLSAEHQAQYDSQEVWDRMVLDVVEFLGGKRGPG